MSSLCQVSENFSHFTLVRLNVALQERIVVEQNKLQTNKQTNKNKPQRVRLSLQYHLNYKIFY